MSVATKRYVSSYGNSHHTDEMAQRPRSPAPNYIQQQRMNNSVPSHESTLKRPSPSDDDDSEHRDKRQRIKTDLDTTELHSSIQATNHERQQAAQPLHVSNSDEIVNASPHTAQRQTTDKSVQESHEDQGGAFLLCKSSVPRSRPDPQQHLLAMYGLSDLLKSVARTDPFTGEKINKLRKSYEGQIKTFGLAGRNKAEKADRAEDEPGPLRKLAIIPEAKWMSEQGKNDITVTDAFREKLKLALQIQPGRVRNNAEWEDILGHEKPRPNIQPQQVGAAATISPAIPRMPNGFSRTPTTTSGDKRSTRGKKRSYGDESFVGYGEGYSDMDDDGDNGDDANRRRRKKDSFGHNSR